MKKHLKVDKQISSCNECIHCEYDPYYDGRTDSGFDCRLSNRRIVNDYEYFSGDSIPIPEWCELPDAEGKLGHKEGKDEEDCPDNTC